jgi:glucose-6-phosphate 1-dehydrogenase
MEKWPPPALIAGGPQATRWIGARWRLSAERRQLALQFEVKRPGPVVELAAVKIDFRYDDWFPNGPKVGYETLLCDVMIGDPTSFMRADMAEPAWRVVQPMLDAWAKDGGTNLPIYAGGSSGPGEADELLAQDGRRWRSSNGDGDGRSS